MKVTAVSKQPQDNRPASPSTEQSIQERAYELYVKRGQEPGHELEDWLQAEQEVRQGRDRQRAAR